MLCLWSPYLPLKLLNFEVWVFDDTGPSRAFGNEGRERNLPWAVVPTPLYTYSKSEPFLNTTFR